MKPFSSLKQEMESKNNISPATKPDVVFYANKSMSGELVAPINFPLAYGSAELHGFKYTDTVCLSPLNLKSLDEVTDKELASHYCVKNLKYQAVMQSKGLDGCDGILGLSPKNWGSRSILPGLKEGGMIDRILISFSNAFHPSSFKSNFYDDKYSYVVFGGVNETQIVNG